MCVSTHIMVLGIPDYFLRLNSISKIIGPNNEEILRYFIQIFQSLLKNLITESAATNFTFEG